jgi:hypothetical protein
MGGGRGKLTCTSTLAIVGIGPTIIKAKNAIPKSNFFIFYPPLSISDIIYKLDVKHENIIHTPPLFFCQTQLVPKLV